MSKNVGKTITISVLSILCIVLYLSTQAANRSYHELEENFNKVATIAKETQQKCLEYMNQLSAYEQMINNLNNELMTYE
ncbi:hypothetical protein [Dielma fastidiosa]|uniref:Uncharacterized protein n=1 Tax=Dielma fastidiosa TaxID=1034346 RepID=A0AB35UU04_9FIRM|nr:hypothetical protein [Dielma fastidiosa]MDY5168580.1 hypothetical protein [Dielma fastidiosa]